MNKFLQLLNKLRLKKKVTEEPAVTQDDFPEVSDEAIEMMERWLRESPPAPQSLSATDTASNSTSATQRGILISSGLSDISSELKNYARKKLRKSVSFSETIIYHAPKMTHSLFRRHPHHFQIQNHPNHNYYPHPNRSSTPLHNMKLVPEEETPDSHIEVLTNLLADLQSDLNENSIDDQTLQENRSMHSMDSENEFWIEDAGARMAQKEVYRSSPHPTKEKSMKDLVYEPIDSGISRSSSKEKDLNGAAQLNSDEVDQAAYLKGHRHSKSLGESAKIQRAEIEFKAKRYSDSGASAKRLSKIPGKDLRSGQRYSKILGEGTPQRLKYEPLIRLDTATSGQKHLKSLIQVHPGRKEPLVNLDHTFRPSSPQSRHSTLSDSRHNRSSMRMYPVVYMPSPGSDEFPGTLPYVPAKTALGERMSSLSRNV